MQEHVEAVDQRHDLLAQPVQGKRKQQREQNNLQHVALSKSTDHAIGYDVHQEFGGGMVFGRRRVALDRGRIDLAGVDIHAHARLDQVHHQQAEHQRHGRADFKIDHRLRADPPGFLDAAHAGDADHHRGKDDGRQQHLDQFDEEVAQRLEFDADIGIKMAEQYASRQADDDLDIQGGSELLETLRIHGVSPPMKNR